MTKSLITGAAGFLGSNLADRILSDGNEVVGLDNLSTGRLRNLEVARHSKYFRFLRTDICRVRDLPRADRIFHLASPASPPAYQKDPIGTLRVNSEGTRRVLEEARRTDARVLISSTSEVYGDPEVHPQREDYWGHVNPIGIRSCYDEGKRFGEALAMAYRREYGLDVRIARIFNTYGPRMDPKDGRVVSNLLVQGIRGHPFSIYGTGAQTRSFCYVDDLIEGLTRLMNGPRRIPTPMNLGNPDEVTILRAARLVSKVLGVPYRTRHYPIPTDDPKQRRPDISLAKSWLGWRPRTEFEAGLIPTAAYFRSALGAS